MFGKGADHTGVHGAQRAGLRRPVSAIGEGFGDKIRVLVIAGMLGQELVEIVGHLRMALHSQIGLGEAALPAPLFSTGPFQHGHAQAALGACHCRRQTGDTAAHHNQIEV
ncbi:hypothetical protein D3C86_1944060 [compost metagenome]